MAKLVLDTAPTGTGRIVTPDDVRAHARIDLTDEDVVLERLIDTAQAAAEEYTWRRLLKQVWDQYEDGFVDPIPLRYPPLHSDGISAITYTDANGDSQTLSTDTYETGEVDGVPVVRRKYNQTWPTTRDHEDVVKITYTCGYDTAADVPEKIKQAVRIHVAWHYEHREGQNAVGTAITMPPTFYHLLREYRLARHQPIGAA